MAKQRGLLKLSGSLDGICFYTLNGKPYARLKSTLSGTRVKTAPEFKRTRENAQEFGWMAKIGKQFRQYIAELKPFMDHTVHFRLHTRFNRIVQDGFGPRGERLLDLRAQAHHLVGFNYHSKIPIGTCLPFAYAITVNANRTTAYLHFTPTVAPLPKPHSVGATHYRVVLHVFTFSQFAFNTATQGYAPLHSVPLGLGQCTYSAYVDLTTGTLPIVLSATIGSTVALGATDCLVVSAGIDYYTSVNGTYYPLEHSKAMGIIGIY